MNMLSLMLLNVVFFFSFKTIYFTQQLGLLHWLEICNACDTCGSKIYFKINVSKMYIRFFLAVISRRLTYGYEVSKMFILYSCCINHTRIYMTSPLSPPLPGLCNADNSSRAEVRDCWVSISCKRCLPFRSRISCSMHEKREPVVTMVTEFSPLSQQKCVCMHTRSHAHTHKRATQWTPKNSRYIVDLIKPTLYLLL